MRTDWDDRARLNANYYTNSAKYDWSDEEYFETGEINVREHILTDITDICQGDDPGRMRILEIGCGAGRMTKALARLFGEVHAVDISSEMIGIARRNLAGVSNAFFYNNNGMDLSVIPDQPFDFAFSFIVFQHIPRRRNRKAGGAPAAQTGPPVQISGTGMPAGQTGKVRHLARCRFRCTGDAEHGRALRL